jgi:alpha-amylase
MARMSPRPASARTVSLSARRAAALPTTFAAAALALCAALAGCGGDSGPAGYVPGQPLTVDVSSAFPAGTVVRDQYAGKTATVAADGTVTLTPDDNGVLLLEKDGAAATQFTWKGATVYFALTDRFNNGTTTNDGSYGRKKDGAKEIGTWHGGDFKGLTDKLQYLADLGVTALWISPIVEQVHGWVGGGSGSYQHYGYHGYWALDYTRLDKNWGTEDELRALIEGAHAKGIRVLVDVVINHPGYATGADLVSYLPEVFNDGTGAAFNAFDHTKSSKGWDGWNDLVNYDNNGAKWDNWWPHTWIRAGFGSPFIPGGSDELTKSLTFLPDFITEASTPAGFPPLLTRKTDTAALPLASSATVREYLVKWQSDWVRRFGIDGFRCDTAMNVELAAWKALKDASVTALRDWKTANPTKKLDDLDFWTTGEAFGKAPAKDAYYTSGGFDSMINFAYQSSVRDVYLAGGTLAANAGQLESTWSGFAAQVSADPTFDFLSYLSSHDTLLFYSAIGYDAAKQKQAGSALLLAPGGVQIFYGDESGRKLSDTGGDATQAVRSDMNWATSDAGILSHWQKLGTFRKRHAAIGAGAHKKLSSPAGTYAFARTLQQGSATDTVVVVLTAPK